MCMFVPGSGHAILHRQLPFTGMQAVRPTASACLQASTYLNKLPERFESDDKILISDPMLASGEAAAQRP